MNAGDSIWILSQGDYSDYRIEGALTPEGAERVKAELAALGEDGYRVEEIEVIDPKFSREEFISLRCTVWHTGAVSTDPIHDRDHVSSFVHLGEPLTEDEFGPIAPLTVSAVATFHRSPRYDPDPPWIVGVELMVQGSDLPRCRKVFSERKAQLIARAAELTIIAWAESGLRATYGEPGQVLDAPANEKVRDAIRAAWERQAAS